MKKGIERAVQEGRVFHLWFHPTNLADETETMLDGLRMLFEEVRIRRGCGQLEVLTMGALADRVLQAQIPTTPMNLPSKEITRKPQPRRST